MKNPSLRSPDPARLLVPRPRLLKPSAAPGWRLPAEIRIAWQAQAGEPAWRRLAAAFGPRRVSRTKAGSVEQHVIFAFDNLAGDKGFSTDEAYRLIIGVDGAQISASTGAGLAHGASTLAQWLNAWGTGGIPTEEIPGVEIDDRPDLRHRGLMLDISRNRIPTMAELERLVERMASLKFNQLQLYMEHTFAYTGHEAVWRGYDPLTADEVRTLAGWCGERHIELVPNQNSFGHLHRWLVHQPYRRLAECPGGIVHPFSPDPEPFSLCATDPGSLHLLRDLYDQLLPNFPRAGRAGFPGGFLHVGLDETLDLGLGRSREACERLGKERVYLDFLRRVRGLAAEHGRRILFWGDVILEHPEAIADLPADAVALAWGYEAKHPWDDAGRKFAAAGLEFWVCPGTSSWNSFTGRTRNMLTNTTQAGEAAREHGASGYLLCDWGDHGHLQPPAVSLPGLIAGADSAWNRRCALTPEELALLLDLHLLASSSLPDLPVSGATLVELGDVHRLTGAESMNGSALFFQLLFAERAADQRRAEGMNREGLDAVRSRLGELRPGDAELAWAVDMLDLGADLAQVRFAGGVDVPLQQLPTGERRRLWARLEQLLEELGPLWTARSRPGGLEPSRQRWRRAVRGLQA